MFTYCLNNPITYTDHQGFIAKICFDETSDMLSMPWQGANGGGGINGSACGYLVLGRMKYSKDEDVQALYEGLMGFVGAENIQDIKNAVDHLNSSSIVDNGKIGLKLFGGVKKVIKGIMIFKSPLPTPADEIMGIRLIQYGIYNITHGVAQLIAKLVEG